MRARQGRSGRKIPHFLSRKVVDKFSNAPLFSKFDIIHKLLASGPCGRLGAHAGALGCIRARPSPFHFFFSQLLFINFNTLHAILHDLPGTFLFQKKEIGGENSRIKKERVAPLSHALLHSAIPLPEYFP